MKEKTYNDLLEEIVSIRRTITVRNDMIKFFNSFNNKLTPNLI